MQMPENISSLRQRLWRLHASLARLLRTMTSQGPLTPGSFYLLRRKCGKPSCRCARGQLHALWVLTRSEAGKHKLYTVPPTHRAEVRQRAAAWRRYQRARARFIQQLQALVALADQIAESQRIDSPPPWT
jgi:uncharacterized ParB-like nuclease family protein